MFLEVGLVSLEHTVEPGEEFFSAVIAVKDNGAVNRTKKCIGNIRRQEELEHSHAIGFGDGSDVVGCGDGAGDRSLLLVIGKTFACEISSSALRNLNNNW